MVALAYPRIFEDVESALMYVIAEGNPENMVVTHGLGITEIRSDQVKEFARRYAREERSPTRTEYTIMEVPQSCREDIFKMELEAIAANTKRVNPLPYVIEFNVPSPFLGGHS
jgi:hypothetical protein